jgi:ubiquinone/menaquinone biosynthesis C-methylase UbiE
MDFFKYKYYEVEDKARYFDEVKRVIKEDGYFLIIDWEKKEMKMGPPVHERIFKDEMIDLCSKAGFKAIEEVEVSPNHYALKLGIAK